MNEADEVQDAVQTMHDLSMAQVKRDAPTKDDVIRHLTQLRKSLAHALTQRNISPARFNEIRAQLVPLDVELTKLGIEVVPTPQMQAAYVKPSRFQMRKHKRGNKFTDRVMRKVGSISK